MPDNTLPTDKTQRKQLPLATGVLDYFPAALAMVALTSQKGNDQHNPGEPLHWARGKSSDHADALLRHLAERGTVDADGLPHSAKVAWRALALLQEELESGGAPLARGAYYDEARKTTPGNADEFDPFYWPYPDVLQECGGGPGLSSPITTCPGSYDPLVDPYGAIY
jgi:hypothetical protein